MKPIPLYPGLSIMFGDDGTWLHFDGVTHKGAICLENVLVNERIVGTAVKEWIDERRRNLAIDDEHGWTWTTDKPTSSGFYWYLDREWNEDQREVVEVYSASSASYVLRVSMFDGSNMLLEECTGKWAGPLTPPRDGGEDES